MPRRIMITCDTHAYYKKLVGVGFTEQQAEVQAEEIKNIVQSELATKQDITESEERLNTKIAETKTSIAETETRIVKWMLTGFLSQTAFLFGLVKFFA